MWNPLQIKVRNLLAKENNVNFSWVARELSVPYSTLWIAIKRMAPYVSYNSETDTLTLNIVLDPIPKEEFMSWEWRQAETVPIPTAWTNHMWPLVAPRDQGGRGTCVGQDASQAADLLYMAITGDVPLDGDRAHYKKNVSDPSGIIHDLLYPQSHSAEGLYQDSRRLGNVTAPSGSYTSAAAVALLKVGTAWEDMWPTSKVTSKVWSVLPDDKSKAYYAEAAFHKIEGYARITTWDDICAAIHKYGCVMSSWIIFENYYTMHGGDGSFPEPKGSEIGAHSLCLVGYDQDNLYCLHSWGDWCGRLGKISRRYFDEGFLDAFTVLDTADVKRAREEFVTLGFTCNKRANIYVDEKFVGTVPDKEVRISVRRGEKITVRCEAVEYNNLNSYVVLVAAEPAIIAITLTPPTPPSILERLIRWMRNLLNGAPK